MNWTSLEKSFCESIITGPPEPVNAVSSLFMVAYGLCGLFVTRNNSILSRVISGFLLTTGIGSTVYHATLHFGWGIIDSIPMLASSYLGVYMIIDMMVYKKIIVDSKTAETLTYEKIRKYERASGATAAITMVMLTFSIALSQAAETRNLFSIWFLIPELMIAAGVLVIRFYTHRQILDTDVPAIKYATRLLYGGTATASLAAVIWFVTELLCPTYTFLSHLPTHALWHAAISGGMYAIQQFLIYVHCLNKGRNPRWMTGTSLPTNIFYVLVPAVDTSTEFE